MQRCGLWGYVGKTTVDPRLEIVKIIVIAAARVELTSYQWNKNGMMFVRYNVPGMSGLTIEAQN